MHEMGLETNDRYSIETHATSTPGAANVAAWAEKSAGTDLAGEVVDGERLADARWAFTTRRAHLPSGLTLLMHGVQPRQGDLVLARVTGIGHHSKLELPDGRRSQLYQGDEIVVTFPAGHYMEMQVLSNSGTSCLTEVKANVKPIRL